MKETSNIPMNFKVVNILCKLDKFYFLLEKNANHMVEVLYDFCNIRVDFTSMFKFIFHRLITFENFKFTLLFHLSSFPVFHSSYGSIARRYFHNIWQYIHIYITHKQTKSVCEKNRRRQCVTLLSLNSPSVTTIWWKLWSIVTRESATCCNY